MADNNNNEDEPFGITSIPTATTSDDASGSGAGAPVSITLNEEIINNTIFNNTTGSIAQQPQTEAFAVYEGIKNSCEEFLIRINSQQIDLNSHFLIYTVKNGLLRVFHRHSAMRALLRGHAGQIVSDIKFFHDGDVVGTIGNSKDGSKSTLIVWRVYEKAPEIGSERLLEISSLEDYGSTPDLSMSSLFWHPFNPNQFFFTHTTQSNKQVATLVETTRIQTRLVDNIDPKDPSSAQHAVCVWNTPYCVMDGALQLKVDNTDDNNSESGELVDMCWSGRDARHVLSVHKNGTIVLWDLKCKDKKSSSSPGLGLDSSDDDDDDENDDNNSMGDDNVVLPKKLFVLKNKNTPYSRCFFLPHEQSVTLSASGANNSSSMSLTTCFVTASHTNSVVTVWSAFLQKGGVVGNGTASLPTLIAPTKLQEINLSGMGSPSSFVLNVCFGPAGIGAGPPSSFLLLGSREVGRLYALHIKSEWSETKSLNNGEAAPIVPLCVGIDYMVPFSLKHPVYSWSVVCGPSDDDGEDGAQQQGAGFDMMAFSYQSKAIQNLKITNSMCLPPSGGGVKNTGNGGVFTVEPLSGPYVENANDPKYDEDEYDIDDIDENEGGSAIAPTAAAAKITAAPTPAAAKITSAPAPAPSGGGLFPGAANPFANWLGGIASAVSSSTSKATTEDDDLPEPPPPPQPSAMGMGMDNNSDVVPPPPPPSPGMAAAIMGTPPGMPSKTPTPPAASPVAADPEPPSGLTVQEFLNPLELLKNSQSAIELQNKATAASAAAATDDDKPTSNNKQKKSKKAGRSKSPKNTTSKSRSKSPKGKRNNTSNTSQNKSPFPDTKVTILKRSPDSADSLSQLAGSATTAAPTPPLPPVVAAVQQIDSKQLEEEVTQAVEKAISKLVPSINKTVQESFASLARPLRNSMDALSKNGVTVDSNQLKEVMDVETPLKAELANTVRTVLVPTLEAIAGQILNEVKTSLPKLIPAPLPPPPAPAPPIDHQTPKLLAMLSSQLLDMSSKMDALTTEVQALKATVADHAAAAALALQQQQAANTDLPSPPPQQPPKTVAPNDPNAQLIKVRNEVDGLLRQEKYEQAFTKAVATTTPQMAVYCCARSDLKKVLQNGNTPCLSQAILICLMQQLSAALAHTQNTHNELQVEVLWLQEIALCMNPSDVSIQQHVPRILEQLITNVSNRISMEEQADPNSRFRRPLQMLLQILRGMQ